MSTLNVNIIRDAAGTGAPDFDQGLEVNGTPFGPPTSQVCSDTGNGHGSTATSIRRFTNNTVTGTDISVSDTPLNGTVFTVNADGVYGINWTDRDNGGNLFFGASLNSASLTSSISLLPAAERPAGFNFAASGEYGQFNAIVKLSSGDVIRPHATMITPVNGTDDTQFSIVQIVKLG